MLTAQILIIGDEILSGRTADTNSHFLARALGQRGVRVRRVQVLPDDLIAIADTIHATHALFDFTLVCGGIGGTPDDVTRQAVAKGFRVPLKRHPEAEKILKDYYGAKLNADRLSMADLPEGCELIPNKVTRAPGFKIKNVYVFAGIPEILYAMFENVKKEFQGPAIFEEDLNLQVGEGDIAQYMVLLNQEFPALELGSYPTLAKDKGYRTQLVFKSGTEETVKKAIARFKELYLRDHSQPAWK